MLDESPNISGKVQLLSFVRFVYRLDIFEEYLFCRKLETRTAGADIFASVDSFFQDNGLKWMDWITICTDSATTIIGNLKGFLNLVVGIITHQ